MKRIFWVTPILSALLLFSTCGKLWSVPIFQVENTDSVEQAIQALQVKIESEPENYSLHCRLGYLYLKIKKWGEAESSFRNCLALNDTSAQAYNGLGLAYHGKGESAIIPIEALKKLFKIDNYSKAEKNFKRALNLRPDYIDPLYNMGVNYLAKGGRDNYQRAVLALKKVLLQDDEFRDADFMLGVAYLHLKDYVNAEETFKNVIGANRTVAKAMLRLSEVYLETGKEKEATHYYYEGVMELRDPETWELIYSEMRTLMEPEEREQFLNLPIESKGSYVRKFWKRKDPTPTTEENERFIEHFRRIQFARATYPDIIPPYYDDRGKVYVKYGFPDAKFVSQVYSEGVKQNESWSYEQSIRKGLTFDFVEIGQAYRLVHDLTEAAPTGMGMEDRLNLANQLYQERAGFTESYNRFSLGNIDRTLIDFQAERAVAQQEAPVEAYQHELEGEQLSFIYNVSQFRDLEGKSRTEVYVGVPCNSLRFLPSSDGVATSLEYSLVVQDSDYVDVYNRRKKVIAQAESLEEIHGRLLLYQEDFQLTSGEYVIAVRVENPQGNSRGVYKNDFEIRDFQGDSLMMSDLQFASRVDSASGEGMFIKRGLKVVPYPYMVIRRGRPIIVYFELYNLKFNTTNQTDYTLTYKIDLMEYERSFFSKTIGAIGRLFGSGKKPGISTSYQQLGTESATSEYLSLNMRRLPRGAAQMTVIVKDNTSGETASRSIKFQLID